MDGELGRMNTDGQTTGTGVEIVSSERSLPPFVESAIVVKCEWMSRNHES
jgi:hypothetical protein